MTKFSKQLQVLVLIRLNWGISLNEAMNQTQREVPAGVCDARFDVDGNMLSKCGNCASQRKDCVSVVLPLASAGKTHRKRQLI